jgi:inhibitor of lysozyme (Ivy)
MKLALTLFSLCLMSDLALAEGPYPWDLLKDRKFRDAYYTMLGKKRSEKWLSALSGPSEPAKKITISDTEYLFVHSCKAHECDSHNIVIIYSPTLLRMYGKLGEDGALSTLGKPSTEISATLDKLYNDEFGDTN